MKSYPLSANKSFLKWAGGKSKLVPFIVRNLPTKAGRLVEPFAGSAALSLAVEFDGYLLNDTNQDLINLYQVLKQEKQRFIQHCRSFFTDGYNQESRYYELRDQFNDSKDIIERSALFIYLNRHGFNGLCRYNQKGLFNVPFGKYKKPYFPEKELLFFVGKSDRIELMNTDFQEVLPLLGKDDVVYCDPPYVPLSETASFTAYSQGDFTLADQKRLASQTLQIFTKTKGILISNHDTAFTREIYEGARIETIEVQRNIAAKGSSRQKVNELLVIYK